MPTSGSRPPGSSPLCPPEHCFFLNPRAIVAGVLFRQAAEIKPLPLRLTADSSVDRSTLGGLNPTTPRVCGAALQTHAYCGGAPWLFLELRTIYFLIKRIDWQTMRIAMVLR